MPEDQQQNYQEQLESDRALSQNEQEREEENKENQPETSAKMDTMLFAILLLLCVVADLVDMITVGTIGWVMGLFVDAVLLLAVGLSKGGRKQFKRIIIGIIGEKIPVINILPFRSLFLIWSFVKSRSATIQSVSTVSHKVI